MEKDYIHASRYTLTTTDNDAFLNVQQIVPVLEGNKVIDEETVKSVGIFMSLTMLEDLRTVIDKHLDAIKDER